MPCSNCWRHECDGGEFVADTLLLSPGWLHGDVTPGLTAVPWAKALIHSFRHFAIPFPYPLPSPARPAPDAR